MKPSQNLNEFITTINNAGISDITKMISVVKQLCGREVKYRWVSDDRILPNGLNTRGLIVLCSDPLYQFKRLLQNQCNGVIIKYDLSSDNVDNANKFNILAVPPGAFDPNYRLKRALSDPTTKIYPIIDGTTCTLFYYGTKWLIGTARGCNMNDQSWNGDITFEEALFECTKQYDFNYNLLDEKFIYTIGFSHPKMHPLATECNAWLISVSLSGYAHHQDSDNLMLLPSVNDKLKIPAQLPLDTSFEHMTQSCMKSITNYISGATKTKPVYGYVIRTASGSYLMRSKLMEFIKKYYHTLPNDIPIDRKREYVNIRGYLSHERNTYAHVFGVSELFSKYNSLIDELAAKVVNYGRLKASARQLASEKCDPSDIIVTKIFNMVDSQGINTSTTDGLSIIVDLMMNKNNLDLYFDSKLM